MNSVDYWKLFMETGAPELYLMYHSAKKMESKYVSDCSGPGASCCEL